jgi:hypothetical protein
MLSGGWVRFVNPPEASATLPHPAADLSIPNPSTLVIPTEAEGPAVALPLTSATGHSDPPFPFES